MAYIKKSKNIQARIRKGWTPDKLQNDDDVMEIKIKDRYNEPIINIKVVCDEYEDIKAYKVWIGQDLWADYTVNRQREYEFREV